MDPFLWHQWSLVVFILALLGIAFLNFLGFPLLKPGKPSQSPQVSVLIPVRDEEDNIRECLESVLSQDYPHFEVWVYEEGSRDRTPLILAEMHDPRLHVVCGEQPPSGWLGKPWACAQLARRASGGVLLFLDADVQLAPNALSSAVAALERERLDFLSGLPRQEVQTLGAAVHVALIPWSLSSFFPLFLARLRRVAVGQCIVVRREAYERIGGHAALPAEVLEDMALASRAAQAGLKLKLFFLGELANCRMYRDFWAANAGLAKNLFPLFKRRLVPFLFVWTWLLYVAWQPLFLLPLALGGLVARELLVPSALAVAGSLALWALTVIRFQLPLRLLPTYPLVHLVSFVVAIRSAFWHLSRRGTWKGRSIHVQGG